MKPRAPFGLLVVAAVLMALGGCGTSADSRFYTLDATATAAAGRPALDVSVMVSPVAVPAIDDQPQIVVTESANRVRLEEFNRWAAPLDDVIARAVAGDLATLLGTRRVTTAPLANFEPAYIVALNVERFESIVGSRALIEVAWTVRDAAAGKTRSGSTLATEPVAGDDFAALAAAHSRALARVSEEIAAAIRADAEMKTAAADPSP